MNIFLSTLIVTHRMRIAKSQRKKFHFFKNFATLKKKFVTFFLFDQ